MKRDNCFDFLRFIFAFNVVLGHLTVIALFPEYIPFRNIFNTYFSVTGFFVISGFLIAQSYEHSTLTSYFSKRAKRLLPAYVFVVTVCALGLSGISTLPANEYFFSSDWWQYIGANLTFMNFLHPSLPGVFDNPVIKDTTVNPSLWTLKIEVGFYLIIPLLMAWLRKSKRPWLVLLLIYVLAVIWRNTLNIYGDRTGQDMPVFLARQLPGFMSFFAAGMAGYLYKDLFLKYKNRLILPAIVVFITEYYCFSLEILFPAAWAAIVLWCAWSIPALNNFGRYGDISYGIYIYHGPLLKILLSIGLFTSIDIPYATAIYILCVLTAGYASWHLMEKKFLKRR